MRREGRKSLREAMGKSIIEAFGIYNNIIIKVACVLRAWRKVYQ